MKKLTLLTILTFISLSGCTQIVTAPIAIAGTTASAAIDVTGATASAAIDVTGSAVHAIAGSDEEDKD